MLREIVLLDETQIQADSKKDIIFHYPRYESS